MTRYAPILHHLLQSEICKIHWKNMYFWFIAPFRKLRLTSSALSHGHEVKFPLFASHLASFCAKMLAALSTSKAKAHATHVSVAQHISKSTPFRYCSLHCKPSRFRPHAIADFRLHASFRRSETGCRAQSAGRRCALPRGCLLYTSDAADE